VAELLNQIANFIEALIVMAGYPGIFLLMFIENIFPPMPSDPIMPFAGILVARGNLSFAGVWVASVAGGVLGSILLYSIGVWTDNHLVRHLVQRYGHYLNMQEEDLDRAMQLFNQYGALAVFIGRMMPLVRSVVSLAAGMSRMSLSKFIFFTTLSSMIANTFWILIGYILGENWRVVLIVVDELEPYLIPIFIVIAMAFGAYIVLRLMRRYRDTRGSNTSPKIGQETSI